MTPSKKLYIPIYTITLLLSAFLLFLVQPMFGKMILPLLGGSPSVWNAAMLFFQVTLLAGYAYAHGTARFMSIKAQALLHITLLLVFTIILPVAIPEGWTPPAGSNDPTLWQLALMTVAVGGPFFVLSGSAPMLQHWFSYTKHPDSDNPYFLYAASNLGSISALLLYPFFIEPALGIAEQSSSWAWGYGLLIILVMVSALLVWRHTTTDTSTTTEKKNEEAITWQRRALWLVLAFVPSSLMLGVTTFITTDLASAPLLWIVPLALYVSTFIIAFAKKPFIGLEKTYYIQGFILIMILSFMGAGATMSKFVLVMAHLLLFFFTALMCHHELSATRPHTKHLTQFYLIMSLGGALGGFFNAIIAPNLFVVPIEYGIILALGCFMRESNLPQKSLSTSWRWFKNKLAKREDGFLNTTGLTQIIIIFMASAASLYFGNIQSLRMVLILLFLSVLTMNLEKRWVFGFCALIILTLHPPGLFQGKLTSDKVIHRDRNFFGIIKIIDSPKQGIRLLLNGTTYHGAQALAAKHKHLQISYYSEKSGFTDAFEMASAPGNQNIAVLGLGIGVVSCYQKKGRHFDFFEINPNVIKIAEDPKLFTYLSNCGSPYKIIQGDARLKMIEQPDDYYDIIVMDAFSSDSIPLHLLTLEAFELYKRKLKKDGHIVVHISNRYLNLKPVVSSAASTIGMETYNRVSKGGKIEGMPFHQTDLTILTAAPAHIDYLEAHDWKVIEPNEDFRLWTDQYSNITALFKFLQRAATEKTKN